MKKIIALVLVAGTFAIYSCGPSAEEKAAAEKATQDSIAAVEKAYQDSIAMAQAAMQKAEEDSINAAKMKAMEDSMAMMKDQANKPAPKPKPKSIEQKKKEEATKATQGRG